MKAITGSFVLEKNKTFAGEDVPVILFVQNRKWLPFRAEADLPCGGLRPCTTDNDTPSLKTSLLWLQSVERQWILNANKRGVYRIGPMRMGGGDLFGHFQKDWDEGEVREVVVYPRLISLPPVVFPKRDFFGVPGSPSPVHDPVYILGTTDYHHSTPARFIHWKASARHDRLQVKLFESTEQEKIIFVVDVRSYAFLNAGEAFERALEVVGSFAVVLDRQGFALGMCTNGIVRGVSPVVPISRGLGQARAALEVLARLMMKEDEKAPDIIHYLKEIPWGTTCLYFSYEADERTKHSIEYLKRNRIPFMLYTKHAVDTLRGDVQKMRPQTEAPV